MLLYTIWFLLPLTLLVMSAWAWIKKVAKKRNQEDAGDYFSQGIFCLVAFAISVMIDSYFLEDFVDAVTAGTMDSGFARWMLFPVVMTVMAYLNRHIKPRKAVHKSMPGSRYVKY